MNVTKWWSWLVDVMAGLLASQQLKDHGSTGATITKTVPLGSGYNRDTDEGFKRHVICQTALKHVGNDYKFGGKCDPNQPDANCEAMDCSGLTSECYRVAGLYYPDGTWAQSVYLAGGKVKQPKEGDVFFFSPDAKGIGHTGVYAFGGVIEARSHHTGSVQDGHVKFTAKSEIEQHPRFAGWFRHPEFKYPLEERA